MIRNKNWTSVILFIFAFVLLVVLSVDVEAQRKIKRPRTVTPNTDTILIGDRRKGAQDVGIQIKNISKFVFVLGGIATGIEDIDREIKAGKASVELKNKNAEFKDNVLRSIRALRAGLMKLEVDFRAKPALQPYLASIEGVYIESARAENLAAAGNLNDSGKELLFLVEKLTDVLVVMP